MDNVTHTLFALTLARTPLGRAGRGTTVALVLASNAPDVDIVATLGGAESYLRWHRGPTHGPLGVMALGKVTVIKAFWSMLPILMTRTTNWKGAPATTGSGTVWIKTWIPVKTNSSAPMSKPLSAGRA